MTALWKAMWLAEHYGRLTMTLDEVSEQLGIAAGTIRNRRMAGEFTWLRQDGRELRADVADVAAYLDRQRHTAGAETPASPQRTESSSPSTHAPAQRGGRRRRSPSLEASS